MDHRTATTDFSGLPSPYSSFSPDPSKDMAADSAAQHYSQSESRQGNYSTTATPTSDYSAYPPSARSSSFPEHQMSSRVAGYHQPAIGGTTMAQNNSSQQLSPDGADHQDPQQDPQQIKSDSDVPIDPSIAAPSPTQYNYPASPYTAGHTQDMAHGYAHTMYQTRPDWGGYSTHGTPITPGHHVFPQTPTTANTQSRNQVYSFVPIPGAQQHKRPRRRYEEIERMYKCGWNGCEKAYGTLNHLNAHVTMQSHGQKRIPEEFKEIRKEWKARKKAEEAERKQREEEARAQSGQNNNDQAGHDSQPSSVPYTTSRLPPIGYQPSSYPQAPAVSLGADYSNNYITTGSYNPSSPYAQSHQQVYGAPNGGQTQ